MNVRKIQISELEQNDNLINIGIVLETQELQTCYEIIVLRMNEKQVHKFLKDQILFIADHGA